MIDKPFFTTLVKNTSRSNRWKVLACESQPPLSVLLLERDASLISHRHPFYFYSECISLYYASTLNFLLNLGDFRVDTVLPNDIGRCVNHGAETYNVHANYRLDDESPIKIEVLYNYTKLLSRIELSYKSLK